MSSNLKVNTILPSTGTTVAVSGIASVTSSVSIASSCTATTFYGSGANLTSLPSQLTLSNNADNRIITGGSGVNLNGEANLTFTGSALNVVGTIDADDVVSIDGSSNVDLRIQTGANNRLVIRGASSLSNIITQNNNNLSFRHDGGTGGGSEIFLMNSNGIDVGNNKRIQIKDYYGDVSGRIENSDSTNNSLRIDVDPDDSGASSVFMVRIDGNELVRLNHNGKFGIGMNDPAATLHVGGSADTSPQVRIQRTSGYNNAWKIYQSHYGASDQGTLFLQPTLATTPNVEITNAAGDMAMRVDSDTGVISVKNGGGIDFSATSNASGMTNELLDDYEEGSFTPFIRTANNTTEPSYSHRVGLYTRVGRLVTYAMRITTSGELSTGSGGTQIHGLPFNAMNWNVGDWPGGAEIAYYSNLRGNYGTNPRLLGPYNNNTYIRFHLHNAQTDTGNNLYNHIFTNNTVMIIYGQYFAA